MTAFDNFYWSRKKLTDGSYNKRIHTYCKDCDKARVKRWRGANLDKVSRYNKTWYHRNLEQNRARYRERNRIARGKFRWTWKKYRLVYEEDRLPIEPFRSWLHLNVVPLLASKSEISKARGEGHGVAGDLITWTSIADSIGADRKGISNYANGKAATVPRELVDHIGLLFGHMDLSDDLYETQIESEDAA